MPYEDLLLVSFDVGDGLAERGQKVPVERFVCLGQHVGRNAELGRLQVDAIEFPGVLGDGRIAPLGDLAQNVDHRSILLTLGAGQSGRLQHFGAELLKSGREAGIGGGKDQVLQR